MIHNQTFFHNCIEFDDPEAADFVLPEVEEDDGGEDGLKEFDNNWRPNSEFMALLADLSSISPQVVVILHILII